MILGRDDWRTIKQRPDVVLLDSARAGNEGLLFAGLGNLASDGGGHPLMLDSGLYENHGTLTNMEPASDWLWSDYLGRWVLDYDGTNAYVALPVIGVTSDFTISCWSNWQPIAASEYAILGSADAEVARNNWRLRYVSSMSTIVYLNFSNYASVTWTYGSPSGVAFHGLHHLAITRSGTSYRLYLDGDDQGDKTSASTINWAIAKRIGGHGTASVRHPYLGQLGDMLIAGKAYSQDTIKRLADPSNVMLDGLILPPARRMFPVAVAAVTYDPMFFHAF